MKTVEINLFKFDELSEEAKNVAIENFRESCLDEEWYCFIYEDAKQVGIKIESFDIYRGEISINLNYSLEDTAYKIIFEHGEYCDTYKAAKSFLDNKSNLVTKYSNGVDLERVSEENYDLYDEEIEEFEQDFRNDLENAYLSILRNEYEYQQSDEYIIEYIQANEYDFTEDGKIY